MVNCKMFYRQIVKPSLKCFTLKTSVKHFTCLLSQLFLLLSLRLTHLPLSLWFFSPTNHHHSLMHYCLLLVPTFASLFFSLSYSPLGFNWQAKVIWGFNGCTNLVAGKFVGFLDFHIRLCSWVFFLGFRFRFRGRGGGGWLFVLDFWPASG